MLDPTLSDWLDRQADALDRGDADPAPAALPSPAQGRGREQAGRAAAEEDRTQAPAVDMAQV
ncbi:hypothetical protein, partial [Pseudomonas aeruginosa]|uniref:hypothetical protein n=1 Tax=Pseudomonas aeruginosa TaxID=287 RepID=UPI0021562F05